jgi:uncharacterized protein YndB with AHSA1/START domain
MSSTPIPHGSFVIERRYPTPLERVWKAWIDPALKARWFIGPPSWTLVSRTLDVRVGGEETLKGKHAGPPPTETLFTARYHQVVMLERLVYVYDMHLNGNHHSLSLATVEFERDGGGTKQRFTEQVAFLDGTPSAKGVPSREMGTALHLDRLMQLIEGGELP